MVAALGRAKAAELPAEQAWAAPAILLVSRGQAVAERLARGLLETIGEPPRGEPERGEFDLDAALHYHRGYFGEVPERVALLAERSPLAVAGYTLMHQSALREGPLPPARVELVLCGVNAAEFQPAFAGSMPSRRDVSAPARTRCSASSSRRCRSAAPRSGPAPPRRSVQRRLERADELADDVVDRRRNAVLTAESRDLDAHRVDLRPAPRGHVDGHRRVVRRIGRPDREALRPELVGSSAVPVATATATSSSTSRRTSPAAAGLARVSPTVRRRSAETGATPAAAASLRQITSPASARASAGRPRRLRCDRRRAGQHPPPAEGGGEHPVVADPVLHCGDERALAHEVRGAARGRLGRERLRRDQDEIDGAGGARGDAYRLAERLRDETALRDRRQVVAAHVDDRDVVAAARQVPGVARADRAGAHDLHRSPRRDGARPRSAVAGPTPTVRSSDLRAFAVGVLGRTATSST